MSCNLNCLFERLVKPPVFETGSWRSERPTSHWDRFQTGELRSWCCAGRDRKQYLDGIRGLPQRGFHLRGWAWFYLGEYDKATADWTEAIRLDRKHAEPYSAPRVTAVG